MILCYYFIWTFIFSTVSLLLICFLIDLSPNGLGDGCLVAVAVPPLVGCQGALSFGSQSPRGQWGAGPAQYRDVPKGKNSSLVMNIVSAEANGPTSYSVYVK